MIIDSSAVISIMQQESDAAAMSDAIAGASIKRMGTPSFLEICMVITGRRASGAIEGLDIFIQEAGIELISFTPEAARIAAQAFLQYGTGRHPAGLNFGDCISYAMAKTEVMPLLFKGNDFRLTDIEAAL
ncbi:MAG TPA: type II toxin-antitoxin system VapC family toxin [Aestuariivirga sp.]|nr:type II toxin-antitoxin system VapC family toxin [Aestuariivirga sp.]